MDESAALRRRHATNRCSSASSTVAASRRPADEYLGDARVPGPARRSGPSGGASAPRAHLGPVAGRAPPLEIQGKGRRAFVRTDRSDDIEQRGERACGGAGRARHRARLDRAVRGGPARGQGAPHPESPAAIRRRSTRLSGTSVTTSRRSGATSRGWRTSTSTAHSPPGTRQQPSSTSLFQPSPSTGPPSRLYAGGFGPNLVRQEPIWSPKMLHASSLGVSSTQGGGQPLLEAAGIEAAARSLS